MLLTLALVVFAAAIIILFSQEFISIFKKIAEVKGAKLIIPLAIASWLVYRYDFWFIELIHSYREVLHTIIKSVVWLLPYYKISIYITVVLVLTIISLVPVFLLDWIFRMRTYKPYPYPYVTSFIIWLVSVLTLTII